MHITVSGKQVDVGDALRTYVAEQLGIISGKYFDHALEAQVVFSKARSFFMCDIQMHAGRNIIMRGEGEAQDAHAAFDAAAEHVGKRLRRYRRKVNDHARDLAHRERPLAATQYVLSQERPAGADDEGNGHADGSRVAGGGGADEPGDGVERALGGA